MLRRWCFMLLGGCLLYSSLALAQDIEVLALFGDKAMIRVDGQKHVLRVGEASPEGIRLTGVEPAGARLLIDGKPEYVRLGARLRPIQSAAGDQAQADVVIWKDRFGMFSTVGTINGMPVNFLVDTGATTIALNAAEARRLGIDFRVDGDPARVMTATRTERGYRVMLDRVKVGAIELRNVAALVFDGPEPKVLLLGMSFLGRLEMHNDGQSLRLKKKY